MEEGKINIKRKIASATPIYRFRDLSKLEGIGKQTYNDVFRLLYSLANQTDNQDFVQKPELVNLDLFTQTIEYLNQPRENILQFNQPVESEEEKIDFMSSIAIYVAPNTGGESFGIILAEALAGGACVLKKHLLFHKQQMRLLKVLSILKR